MSNTLTLFSSVDFPKSAMGPFQLTLVENCELIEAASIEIGFAHRGIESSLEKVNYTSGNIFAEKVDFLSAPACSLAFALGVEKLCNIQVPEVAEYSRILILELNRISNHLLFLAQIGLSAGSASVFQYSMREREKYADIFEAYCGSRMLFQSIRIGGVCNHITEGLLFKIERAFLTTKEYIQEIEKLLIKNPIFQNRTIGIAKITKDKIIENNISGPNARSSGSLRDVRSDHPYGLYEKYFVNLETSLMLSHGDIFARVLTRILEIKQSIMICEKVFRDIPLGNCFVPVGNNFIVPEGQVYKEVESPRGEFGVFMESVGGPIPQKIKFVSPSFFHLRCAAGLLRSEMIEDVELIFNSLDISMAEVDR